jgi:hypothetical protein
MVAHPWLAAEMEASELRIPYGPAAVMRQQRSHRLPLVDGNDEIIQ